MTASGEALGPSASGLSADTAQVSLREYLFRKSVSVAGDFFFLEGLVVLHGPRFTYLVSLGVGDTKTREGTTLNEGRKGERGKAIGIN